MRANLLPFVTAVTAACSTRAATPVDDPAIGGPGDDQRYLVRPDLDVLPDDAGYVWLEDIGSDTVRRWAGARTSHTRAYFTALPVHDSLIPELQSARAAEGLVLQPGVVPPAMRTGPNANWISAGVGMRQPWDRFERGGNEWRRVLDLDSLSAALDARVDGASVECLPPAHDRCLLRKQVRRCSNSGTSRKAVSVTALAYAVEPQHSPTSPYASASARRSNHKLVDPFPFRQ